MVYRNNISGQQNTRFGCHSFILSKQDGVWVRTVQILRAHELILANTSNLTPRMAEIDKNTIAIGKGLLYVVSSVYILVCYSDNGALRVGDKARQTENSKKSTERKKQQSELEEGAGREWIR